MSEKTYTRGHFVWRELMSPDIEASRQFYSDLFGWTYEEHPMPGDKGAYTVIKMGTHAMGGMVSLATMDRDDIPPHWMGYVSMADIDGTASTAQANGATLAVEPTDVPTVGRFSVIGDPQHAYSSVINFDSGDPPPQQNPGVGMFCWEDLTTTDVDGAVAFYEKVYGWQKRAFAGGGDIATFFAGEVPVASVVPAPEGVPAHWLSYVVVENLAAARDRVIALGGSVTVEAIPVPTVGTISVVCDPAGAMPAGAMIGLFEPPAA